MSELPTKGKQGLESSPTDTEHIPFQIHEIVRGKKTKLEIQLPETYKHLDVGIMIGEDLMTFTANHHAIVSVRRNKLVERIQEGKIYIV